MTQTRELKALLENVARGDVQVDDAVAELRRGPFGNGSWIASRPDVHRRLRLGQAEVIYGAGKSIEQIVNIATTLGTDERPVLITRLAGDVFHALQVEFPGARFNDTARTCVVNPPLNPPRTRSFIAILSAGTTDQAVVEEAVEALACVPVQTRVYMDMGVAGLHRLVPVLPDLDEATAIIVAAGMDGALPSVVAGLVAPPVIGLPTSVGYGAHMGGAAALLSMLNTCVPGLTVVNIDNGVGAAAAAHRIVNRQLFAVSDLDPTESEGDA